jgi:hypothetical protein
MAADGFSLDGSDELSGIALIPESKMLITPRRSA